MSPDRPTAPLGSTVLPHRFQTWGFIFLFGVMIPTLAVQGLLSPEDDGRTLAIVALVTAPIAWWLLLEARFRVVVSERGISARSPRGPRVELAWDEVTGVRYRSLARLLEIRGDGGAADEPRGSRPAGPVVIRVSLLRDDVGVLARLLARHVPRSAFDENARVLFRGRG